MSLPSGVNIRRRKSGSGVGLGLGGAMHADELATSQVNNIWRKITFEETLTGVTIYRGFYIYNNHSSEPLKNVVIYFSLPVTNSGIEISLGHGTSGISATSVEPAIATESTNPTVRDNVWHVDPKDRASALTIDGVINAGEHAFVWMRMVVPSGTQTSLFTHYKMRVEMLNLASQDNIPETWGIVLAGNLGYNAVENNTLFLLTKRDFQWFQCAGNMLLPNQTPEFFNRQLVDFGLRPKTKICIGQAESDLPFKNALKNEHGLTEDYHSYDVFNAHFTVMGWEDEYTDTSPQYEWVRHDLERARKDADIDWLIVVVNDAMYGHHSSYDRDTSESLRDLYHPLFMEHRVHLVLSCAAPRYERHGVLAYNESDGDTPVLKQDDQASGESANYTWFDKGFEDGGNLFINIGTGGANPIAPEDADTGYTKVFDAINWGFVYLQFDSFGNKLFIIKYSEHDIVMDKADITHTLPP